MKLQGKTKLLLEATFFIIIFTYLKYTVDAVGLSQIFFPTQNLERAYQVDKESKAVLSYFQYNQCAGPQKQEVINHLEKN